MTRARVMALAAGVPVLLTLIGWTGLSAVAEIGQASFPVRATIPVRHSQVTAQVNSGNITLRQSAAGPDASLTGTARTGVSLSTFGGDVTMPQFTGGLLTLNTDGGDVTAGALAGPVSLSTGGGDATVSTLDDSLRAVSYGGNLTIQAMDSADASVQSLGGDVSLV